VFDHLEQLTDDAALRARLPCVPASRLLFDDVAEAVVVCREPRRAAPTGGRCYLAFVLDALDPPGPVTTGWPWTAVG